MRPAGAKGREAERILAENRRRETRSRQGLYSASNAAELMARQERARRAATLLGDGLPRAGQPVLEVGCGRLGWMADLLSWGLGVTDLHGIDLDETRICAARRAFPGADLRVGDASELPWPDDRFSVVVFSTVLTSVLDAGVRTAIAREATRVLAPTGAIVWYDFRWNNPRNPNVRGIGRRELERLFPDLGATIVSVTLAPPLARVVAPVSTWAASTLRLLPFLRSHLLAVMRKPEA